MNYSLEYFWKRMLLQAYIDGYKRGYEDAPAPILEGEIDALAEEWLEQQVVSVTLRGENE